MSEKTEKILEYIGKQNSILDRLIASLDKLDTRVRKIEEKIA